MSNFHNLMAVGNVVAWAQVDDGEPFPLRPGSEKDRFTPGVTLLWRYMPLKYFLDALERQALVFTRLTFHQKTDAFEGALQYGVSKMHEKIVRERGGDVDQFLQAREQFVKNFLRVVLVNCWHERPYESRPMWDRYGRDGDAVAIVTTFECLKRSFQRQVDIGHIDYVDAASEEIRNYSANPSHRAFQKRREYEDEHEVRCVIFDYPERGPRPDEGIPIVPGTEIGYHVPVDLSLLLKRVVVSPDSTGVLKGVVEGIQKAGLDIPVERSSLSLRPTY